MRRTSIVIAVPIVALLLAACGSSSSTRSAGTPTAAKSTSAATSSTPTTTQVALLTTKQDKKLGTILDAGPKKLTVYLFVADKAGKSTCSGACASLWPPVTTSGQAQVSGAAKAADLGTITRPDGKTQVTYKGHPLYFYAKDGDNKDAYGQGLKSFGAAWYVLAPSGNKIDHS